MNISKFTQKSQEVVQNCEKVAMDYGHQEIAQPHLLASMLTVEDSLIRKLIEKMGIEPDVFMAQIDGLLSKRPKVSGGQLHIDQYLNQTLIYAEDEAKHMGDEYVSVEHLFLSLLAHPDKEVKALLKQCQLFYRIRNMESPQTVDDIPILIALPAFMISEIKTAFQIGFLLYLPFLAVDMVISSILMAMGMMMLPPVMISLPFKILVFVMVDGFNLLTGNLVASFKYAPGAG